MKLLRTRDAMALLSLVSITATSQAAIVTGISQQAGLGNNIDLTAGAYITWGYATGSLGDGFSNMKSGTTAATVTSPTSDSTRDFGYTFTFNDGDSPVSGTAVASSGGQAGLLSAGPEITFAGIVSSTETRRLTLYIGGYHSSASHKVDITLNAKLTNGTSDEDGTAQVFGVNNTTSDGNFVTATYTVEFSSATETDLVIDTSFSNLSGTRNWGVSGYTLEVVPEPGSLALLSLGSLCFIRRRRG